MLIFYVIIIFTMLLTFVILILEKIEKDANKRKQTWEKYKMETDHVFYEFKKDKGKYGEYQIFSLLENEIPGYKKIIPNVYLFNKNNTRTEIDLVMIHETGFYIIESKNYTGYILGNETNEKWTHLVYRGKQKYTYSMFNPILQNNYHVRALERTLNIMNPTYLNSYVVFSGNCKINKVTTSDTCTTKVLKIDDLITSIQNDIAHSYRAFTPHQVDLYYTKLKTFSNKDNRIKQKHVNRIKEKIY